MAIRTVTPDDRACWSEMRTALWPDTDDQHLAEIDAFFTGHAIDVATVLMAEAGGETVGFLELNVRNFAEGSRQDRVPYVEAWYVRPAFQGRGHGKRLMAAAERWAMANGFSELASDTEIDNEQSIAMHRSLGFAEVDRVVCFLKKLKRETIQQ